MQNRRDGPLAAWLSDLRTFCILHFPIFIFHCPFAASAFGKIV
jgi:hypothetical protein